MDIRKRRDWTADWNFRKSESPPCPSSPSVADPCDDDVSLILTPAMEDVLRVREIRKSMEVRSLFLSSILQQSPPPFRHLLGYYFQVSGHFFTPSCSPTDAEEDEEDEAGARRQTVHITESTAEEDDDDDDDDDDEDFQEVELTEVKPKLKSAKRRKTGGSWAEVFP